MHKKMLAVVVADVEVEGEYQFERRLFGSNPDHLRLLARRPAIVPQPSASGVNNAQPLSPMTALALLSNLRSADIVLPTTDGREIRLRRITEPDAEQESLLHQLLLSLPERLKSFSKCSADSLPA